MLVLTRKKNESIKIGDTIEIIVTRIDSDRVKLGITAPSKISIHRKEVYDEIIKENKAALKPVSLDMIQEISRELGKKKKK